MVALTATSDISSTCGTMVTRATDPSMTAFAVPLKNSRVPLRVGTLKADKAPGMGCQSFSLLLADLKVQYVEICALYLDLQRPH